MEQLEIVCENTGNPLGIYLPRCEAISQGAWCRSTNVFVLNKKGEVLCHQRSLKKERMPGVWCTHMGGHVSKDETFETNALKELQEEAGIHLPPNELLAWRTTRIPVSRLWAREFVALHDVPADQLIPQEGEVERFAWKSLEEIKSEAEGRSTMWCAGTHDFHLEYHCMVAVLTAGHALGHIKEPIMAWA